MASSTSARVWLNVLPMSPDSSVTLLPGPHLPPANSVVGAYGENQKLVLMAKKLSPVTPSERNICPAVVGVPTSVLANRSCDQTTNRVLPGRHSQRSTRLLRKDCTLKFSLSSSKIKSPSVTS